MILCKIDNICQKSLNGNCNHFSFFNESSLLPKVIYCSILLFWPTKEFHKIDTGMELLPQNEIKYFLFGKDILNLL